MAFCVEMVRHSLLAMWKKRIALFFHSCTVLSSWVETRKKVPLGRDNADLGGNFCCRSWSFSVLIFSKWVLHLKLLFLKSAPFKITHYFNHWSCGSDCDICWSLAVLSSGFRYRADIASPRPCLCPYPIRLGGFACGAGWLLASLAR